MFQVARLGGQTLPRGDPSQRQIPVRARTPGFKRDHPSWRFRSKGPNRACFLVLPRGHFIEAQR